MIIYFLVSILPFLWAIYFYKKDKHPEPFLWLLAAFILGIFSAKLSLLFEKFFSLFTKDQSTYFFLAASIEEFFKFFLIWLLIFPEKIFDEPVDAMIYMIFSALGFAFVENFIVFLTLEKEQVLPIGIHRFLGANFLHVLASALIGYGYGYLMKTRRLLPLAISFFAAIILHYLFNLVIININLGIFYSLPILWSVFLVVISELDYLTLEDGRTRKS